MAKFSGVVVVVLLFCVVVVLLCVVVVLFCCVVCCCCCVVVLLCPTPEDTNPETLLGRAGRPFGAPLVLGLALLWLWLLWLLLVWTSLDHLPPWTPLRRTAQKFALFLPFPATVSLFLCLSGCLLVVGPPGFHTTAREPQTCTFQGT